MTDDDADYVINSDSRCDDIAEIEEDEFVDRVYLQIVDWHTCELSNSSGYDWEINNMARIKRGIRFLLKEKLND